MPLATHSEQSSRWEVLAAAPDLAPPDWPGNLEAALVQIRSVGFGCMNDEAMATPSVARYRNSTKRTSWREMHGMFICAYYNIALKH